MYLIEKMDDFLQKQISWHFGSILTITYKGEAVAHLHDLVYRIAAILGYDLFMV